VENTHFQTDYFRIYAKERKASRIPPPIVRNIDFYLRFFGKNFQSREYYCITLLNSCQLILTLSLLMAFIFRANNHNFSVSFDNLALIAHRFYRRTHFHNLVTSL